MSSIKPRIAWFSPLPIKGEETSTLSEYCSFLLLPKLRDKIDIELFHNSFEPYEDYPTHHFLTAAKIHEEKPFDAFFYQMEDHAALNFIRIHLGLKPGVVWFHDFIFSTDGPEPILNSPWEETLKKFNNREHPWAERGAEYFKDSPIGYREGGYAVIPAFSSPRSVGDYKAHASVSLREQFESASANGPWGLNVPVEVPSSLDSKCTASKANSNKIAFCGFSGVEKRAHKLLAALANLKGEVSLSWLVANEEKERATEAARSFGIDDAEIITGRSADTWRKLVKESLAAYHCHFSAFGGMAEFLPISMSEGVPIIATAYGDGEHLPDNLVFKIEPGTTEANQTELVLRKLLADEVYVDREALYSYAKEHYSVEAVASEILSMINQGLPLLKDFNSKWLAYEAEAKAELSREAFEILASGDKGSLSEMKESFLSATYKEFNWIAND